MAATENDDQTKAAEDAATPKPPRDRLPAASANRPSAKNRDDAFSDRSWQIALYTLAIFTIGAIPGLIMASDATRYVTPLAISSVPTMLVLAVLYFGYAKYELTAAENKDVAPISVVGNWYLASFAVLLLSASMILLVASEASIAPTIAMTAETILLVVLGAQPIVSVWRRHS